MRLKITGIVENPGSLDFHYTTDFSDLEINFQKPFREPAVIEGNVVNTAGLIELNCALTAMISFDCTRCAEPVRQEYRLDIFATLAELLEDPDSMDNADVVLIENEEVDIDEVVRQALILESDMVFLCDDDCEGVGAYQDGNDEGDAPRSGTDPRLAKLLNLLEETGE